MTFPNALTDPVTPTRPLPAVSGVRHRRVTAGGIEYHVAEAGAGDPVVLLHGFPLHWYAWRRVIPLLAGDHRLICPDLRGSGWSAAPATGYDTGTRTEDLLALLDALELPRVRLVSQGMAATAAFRLCQRAPERVSHHLAIGAIPPRLRRNAELRHIWRFWYTALWEYPVVGERVLRHLPGVTRALLRRWARTPWAEADLAAFVEPSREPARARAGQQLHWQVVLNDIPALRHGPGPRLTVPTLVLGGDSDPVYPAAALRRIVPHADDLTVRIVPGGHLLTEDAPDAVAAAARELFAR